MGDEQGPRDPLPVRGGRGNASWEPAEPHVPAEERGLKLINNEVASVKH